jgi:RNA polymerase sigma-70 factor (ECF subfamily)
MGQPPDRQALDRLMIGHLPASLAFATRLTGSPDAAEDLVQSALLKAARAAHTFRGQSSFKTWFFRILLNAFHDSLPAHRHEEISPELPGGGPTPLAQAMGQETRELVARAVSGLPSRQREVLVLHVYEQFDVEAIASMLDTSQANVRKNLQLARDRLRVVLAGHLKESTRA